MQSLAEMNSQTSAEQTVQLNRANNGVPVNGPVCQCQIWAPSNLFTSWSARNPGRRYYRCANPTGNGRCGFFQWIDGPWDGQALRTITSFQIANARLNQTIGEMERTIGELNTTTRTMDRRCRILTEELNQRLIECSDLRKSVKKNTYLLAFAMLVIIVMMGVIILK